MSMEPNLEDVTQFRLSTQEKSLETNTRDISEIKVALIKQEAKLDVVSTELAKITKLLYTVLGGFLLAFVSAISKLVFKNGGPSL